MPRNWASSKSRPRRRDRRGNYGGVKNTGLVVSDHYWDSYDRRVVCTIENVSDIDLEWTRVRCSIRYGDEGVSQFESSGGSMYPGETYSVEFGLGIDYVDHYVLYLKSSVHNE